MHKAFVHAGIALLLSSCATTGPQAPAEVRAQMAPSGVLVAGINYGNPVIVQRDPAGGPPRGVGPDLARELARRLGVGIRYVTYESAGRLADAAKQREWDVGFLAVDPKRAEDIAFSAPYVQIEGSYLVKRDSPYKSVADLDRPGVRIVVGAKSAYDLYLSRALKNAELVRVPTSPAVIEEVLAGKYDVGAGIKNAFVAATQKNPNYRVVDGHFMLIRQASGVPQGRPLAARYLDEFIEEMKASGFVARSLEKSGMSDVSVAPPGK